jgi:hypothetical protein
MELKDGKKFNQPLESTTKFKVKTKIQIFVF